MEQNQSAKPLVSQSTALHLCFWLGVFGAHNFYAGKTVRGVVQLISAFIFPIITVVVMFVDLYAIIKGTYVDGLNRNLELNATKLPKRIYGLFYPICVIGIPVLAIIMVPIFYK